MDGAVLLATNACLNNGPLENLILLVKAGCDINAKNSKGHTALSASVAGGRDDIVGLLMHLGADPKTRNHLDVSPRAIAQAKGTQYICLYYQWSL
jgi:ankyrin repeat protein